MFDEKRITEKLRISIAISKVSSDNDQKINFKTKKKMKTNF